MTDETDRPSDADVARQAAIGSLVSNLVYLAVLVGFSLALAHRDEITRAWRRVRLWLDPPDPPEVLTALTEVRRDIARFEGRLPS